MRIIRLTASDTRQALRAVREQLGEEAVILTSKRTSEGVEVTAASDLDAAQLQNHATPPVVETIQTTGPTSALRFATAPTAAAAAASAGAGPLTHPAAPSPTAADLPDLAFGPEGALARTGTHVASHSAPPTAAMDTNMSVELRILRHMLESQLEQLAWNERTRRTPVPTEVLRELTEMGILADLAERIIEQLPEGVDLAGARRFALTALSQYLPVAAARWADEGGRVALIGSTGAGKTTTLAKMAVRWVLKNGTSDIALVAADSVRIGAQGELQALARMLGVPVYAPDNFAGLGALLAQLTRYRLVLIDTPGTSVRDPNLSAMLAVLGNSASQLESVLVLPANAQLGAIEEVMNRFAPANPRCCILTKLDEAASLGGVLSVLIRTRLAVGLLSEGQRVPEDLQPARALDLVSAAVRLAKANHAAADEDLLRRRFGKVANGHS
jgi:flagellar biosynthesis protein FlhF